jgi:hypothetical protein
MLMRALIGALASGKKNARDARRRNDFEIAGIGPIDNLHPHVFGVRSLVSRNCRANLEKEIQLFRPGGAVTEI